MASRSKRKHLSPNVGEKKTKVLDAAQPLAPVPSAHLPITVLPGANDPKKTGSPPILGIYHPQSTGKCIQYGYEVVKAMTAMGETVMVVDGADGELTSLLLDKTNLDTPSLIGRAWAASNHECQKAIYKIGVSAASDSDASDSDASDTNASDTNNDDDANDAFSDAHWSCISVTVSDNGIYQKIKEQLEEEEQEEEQKEHQLKLEHAEQKKKQVKSEAKAVGHFYLLESGKNDDGVINNYGSKVSIVVHGIKVRHNTAVVMRKKIIQTAVCCKASMIIIIIRKEMSDFTKCMFGSCDGVLSANKPFFKGCWHKARAWVEQSERYILKGYVSHQPRFLGFLDESIPRSNLKDRLIKIYQEIENNDEDNAFHCVDNHASISLIRDKLFAIH